MKRLLSFLLLLCLSCTNTIKLATDVTLVNNGRSIEFKGLDYAIVSEINRDSIKNIWQNLLPVYRMPADTDLKNYQPAQPGLYQLKDSAIVFTPDTPFKPHQAYFIRYYQFGKNGEIWDYIKGKKKLGSISYTDLIFKQQNH